MNLGHKLLLLDITFYTENKWIFSNWSDLALFLWLVTHHLNCHGNSSSSKHWASNYWLIFIPHPSWNEGNVYSWCRAYDSCHQKIDNMLGFFFFSLKNIVQKSSQLFHSFKPIDHFSCNASFVSNFSIVCNCK